MSKSVILEYNNEICIITRNDGDDIHPSMIDMFNTDSFKLACFTKVKVRNRWKRRWNPPTAWCVEYKKKM